MKCAGPHSESDCTSLDLKCKHCLLKHRANDKSCPTYVLQTRLNNLMSEHNIPFHEAREIYSGNKTIAEVAKIHLPSATPTPPVPTFPSRSNLHFPALRPLPSYKRKIDTTPKSAKSGHTPKPITSTFPRSSFTRPAPKSKTPLRQSEFPSKLPKTHSQGEAAITSAQNDSSESSSYPSFKLLVWRFLIAISKSYPSYKGNYLTTYRKVSFYYS